MIRTSAIVAMADNRCIGRDNDLPWHIPEDLKHFKTVTMGKPIIMGRKTFESIVERLGKPLPGRLNIVVSRGDYAYDGIPAFNNIEDAIEAAVTAAGKDGLDEIFIGGGAQIYHQALPYIDRLYLTEVHQSVDGDAFFPALNPAEWQETEREDFEGDPAFSFKTLERV